VAKVICGEIRSETNGLGRKYLFNETGKTKNRNATAAQQRPEGSSLKSGIVSVLSFDKIAPHWIR